jgi:hypothetical protein
MTIEFLEKNQRIQNENILKEGNRLKSVFYSEKLTMKKIVVIKNAEPENESSC